MSVRCKTSYAVFPVTKDVPTAARATQVRQCPFSSSKDGVTYAIDRMGKLESGSVPMHALRCNSSEAGRACLQGQVSEHGYLVSRPGRGRSSPLSH